MPAILTGDFNQVLETNALSEAFRQHGWHNPLQGHPTSSKAQDPPRIDWLLYNRAAGWEVGAARVDWSLGVPTHAAQWLELPEGPPQAQPFWRGRGCPPPEAPVAHKAARHLSCALRAVRAAVGRQELDVAWQLFERGVCRWHAAACPGAPSAPRRCGVDRRPPRRDHRGAERGPRGCPPPFLQLLVGAAAGPRGGRAPGRLGGRGSFRLPCVG